MSVKTSASETPGPGTWVDAIRYSTMYLVGNLICLFQKERYEEFGLFCEDTQDSRDWRLELRGNQLSHVYLENGH